MATWSNTLTRAGITDPLLRHDYTEQRRLTARFNRGAYTAVRLLLPAPLIPDVIAATAFMHHSDNLIDQGPLNERLASLMHWDKQVREALGTGLAGHPVLRPLLDAVARHPQLREQITRYLAGAPEEVRWESFATESDFQRYIDAYSLPAFMLIACLLAPPSSAQKFQEGCRTFIEASQRLDFLEDITEDLSNGRIGIPEDVLEEHGVALRDFQEAPSDGVRQLIRSQIARIQPSLEASYCLVDLVDPPNQPFVRALITLHELRVRAVARKGPGILRGSVRPSFASLLLLLAREYRTARRHRGLGVGTAP